MLLINKLIGETPLDAIKKYSKNHPELEGIKLAYAGRLDPMAEGVLLVLVGDECKKRKEYERLTKTYEFEVLFGISTDTFDLMGKILDIKVSPIRQAQGKKVSEEDISGVIKKYKGEIEHEYPPYSSPRVNGKPLFWWAREGKLFGIELPKKVITIYDLQLTILTSISSKELLKTVHERIGKVNGDFRQKEILDLWDKYLKDDPGEFQIAKFKIECSSGTYVRSLANSIGDDLQVPSLALSIKRIRIGDFTCN